MLTLLAAKRSQVRLEGQPWHLSIVLSNYSRCACRAKTLFVDRYHLCCIVGSIAGLLTVPSERRLLKDSATDCTEELASRSFGIFRASQPIFPFTEPFIQAATLIIPFGR